MADNDDMAPTERPSFFGGPTRTPIETIPMIDERDLKEFIKRLNYVQGICHSVEVNLGRWEDKEDRSDTRMTGNYVIGEKLMDIVTSLGYANVGFVTDLEDKVTPTHPMIACCLADALYLICNLCAANGWMLGDILEERLKHLMKEPHTFPDVEIGRA